MAQIFKSLKEKNKSNLENIGGAWIRTTKSNKESIKFHVTGKLILEDEDVLLFKTADGGKVAVDKNGKERKNKGGYPITKPDYDVCISIETKEQAKTRLGKVEEKKEAN